MKKQIYKIGIYYPEWEEGCFLSLAPTSLDSPIQISYTSRYEAMSDARFLKRSFKISERIVVICVSGKFKGLCFDIQKKGKQ